MSHARIMDQRVEDYVDQVDRCLDGVDAEERAALLEDVREHASVLLADEPTIDLHERLGPPEAFARDMLDAAGLQAVPTRLHRTWRDRANALMASRVGRIAARAAVDFAPVWAALRGVAVVWIVAHVLNGDVDSLLPWLLIAGGVGGWLLTGSFARFSTAGLGGRLVRYAANLVTLAVGVILLAAWVSSFAPRSDDTSIWPGLALDGSPVSGIQAFGPDGKPAPVALFDQSGSPITVDGDGTDNLTCAADLTVVPVPDLSSSGQQITNAYPARGVCVDESNVVVSEATPMTNGAPVQTWATSALPAVGQTILVNDEGAYIGVSGGSPTATPSASGTPSASPRLPSPSASAR